MIFADAYSYIRNYDAPGGLAKTNPRNPPNPQSEVFPPRASIGRQRPTVPEPRRLVAPSPLFATCPKPKVRQPRRPAHGA
jgi:hypothetical protein